MKKTILLCLLILTLISGVVGASSLNGDYKGRPVVNITVNGQKVKSEVPANIEDGSTLIPLRAVSEALGAEVKWDSNTYSAEITNKKQITDEPWYFVVDGPLHFLHPFIDYQSVTITNREKTIVYQKGVDYKFEDNGITRIKDGHIKEKESVLVNYIYITQPEKNYNSNKSAISKTLTKIHNHQPVTIVFLGDSTLIDTPHLQGFETHVQQIERELKKKYPDTVINVVNKGVGGDAAVQGLKRFQKDVLDLNPDLTVICYGINDLYSKFNLTDFEMQMDTMIKTLSDQGKEVIVRTPNTLIFKNGVNGDDIWKFNEVSKKLADKYNVGFSDIHAKFKDLQSQGMTLSPDLTPENVHPNARAQILITDEIMKFFN